MVNALFYCSVEETDTVSNKNPLLVDFKMPGKQSAVEAWFSKVNQTPTYLLFIDLFIF